MKTTPISTAKEFVDCLFCGKNERTKLYAGLADTVKCRSCGLIYANPRLKREDIQKFYSREYFESHSSEEMGYDNYVSDKELVELTFRKRLEQIERKWLQRRGRVLDVGCATGFFLNTARQMGWEPYGVEISAYCCEYALKEFSLKLHHGFFDGVDGSRPHFELITMWDYIEHSFTPDRDIEKAFKLLSPGGVLALSAPDAGSFPARIFRDRWIGFKQPEHLYYFDKKNLATLLEKKGFKILSVSYIGKFISVGFFGKRLSAYSKFWGGLFEGIAKLPLLERIRFHCNPYDIVYIVAQKP